MMTSGLSVNQMKYTAASDISESLGASQFYVILDNVRVYTRRST
jgi:hypothetical protein